MSDYTIDVKWDAGARVWVATSLNVPGVAIEAPSCEKILEVVEDVLPDLLRGNGLDVGGTAVSVAFDTRVETIQLAAA